MSKAKPNTRKPNDGRAKLHKDADPAAALTADLDRQKAVRLRLEGYTFREIAAAIGVSLETAHRYVNDGWERVNLETDEDRAQLRSVELARLDAMLKRALPIATKDNLLVEKVQMTSDGSTVVREEDAELQFKAMDRVLKIGKRRADLLGLDAPVKSETNITGSALEPLSELAKRVAVAKNSAP